MDVNVCGNETLLLPTYDSNYVGVRFYAGERVRIKSFSLTMCQDRDESIYCTVIFSRE